MKKIVLNNKYGGYRLSSHAIRAIYDLDPTSKAIEVYRQDQPLPHFLGKPPEAWEAWLKENCQHLGGGVYATSVTGTWIDVRSDSALVSVVERLGSARASGEGAELAIKTTRDDWAHILEHDGLERLVAED